MNAKPPNESEHQPQGSDSRRHDLDALRAFAMVLGIVLHAALSFMEIPWVVQDRYRAPEIGYVVSAIHGFRMPLFFLLSGFFTAMLCRRRGLGGLLKQRATRIALPLAVGCVSIVPVMWVVVIWAGMGNTNYGAADAGRDIWTAAALGDVNAVQLHVIRGAALDEEDATYGQSPLAWAIIGDHEYVVTYLLDAGADPNARYRDQNTALHTAAFFGRDDAAKLLLQAGAAVNERNIHRETPLDVMRHRQGTTEFIARLLQISIDFEEIEAGRSHIRTMLEERGAISGLSNLSNNGDEFSADIGTHGTEAPLNRLLASLVRGLMLFPFFHHLWFLWFLCWLVCAYSIVVLVVRMLPGMRAPSILVKAPMCLTWFVPLTALTQSFMHQGGEIPGFGPDTSAGLIPIPHVLAHYAIFFGFGALMYSALGSGDRFGRGWWVQLPLALILFPVALALAMHTSWGRELVSNESARHWLANLSQALFAWLMIFGLVGLFEILFNQERYWVRYLSDSSYWLYLIHLPLIIAGQALLRDVNVPAMVKFLLLFVVTSVILLVSYHLLVRYTLIGRVLNGRRERPSRRQVQQ